MAAGIGLLLLSLVFFLPSCSISNSGEGTVTTTLSATTTTSAPIDLNNLPQFISHNVVDLNKIAKISKFRSATGHNYVDGRDKNVDGNPIECSMKHYFYPKEAYYGSTKEVEVYAPFAGTIESISFTSTQELAVVQISLRSASCESISVTIFHIYFCGDLLPAFFEVEAVPMSVNIPVSGGEFIGYADLGRGESVTNDFDVAVWVADPFGATVDNALVSLFEVMNDAVFASYEARGIPSREAMIISAQYRLANPVNWAAPDPGDWFILN